MSEQTPSDPTLAAETAEATSAASPPTAPEFDARALRDAIIEMIKTCYDPEIPVDIYELGLIYDVDVHDDGNVTVQMTLTSPMCPVAETLPPEVEAKVRSVPGVRDVTLDLVWDPPWSPDLMSEAARLALNM